MIEFNEFTLVECLVILVETTCVRLINKAPDKSKRIQLYENKIEEVFLVIVIFYNA